MKYPFIYIIWLIGIFLLFSGHLVASNISRYKDSVRLACYFSYPQGDSGIRRDIGNNAYELEKLDAFIRSAVDNRSVYVKHIRLAGYCSVEGTYASNEKLAHQRVVGFRNYLLDTYPKLYRYPVDHSWIAEDWDKLAVLVAASNMPEKQEILRIIRNVGVFNGREVQLMNLKGGVPYNKMAKTFFPLLRRVEIVVEYDVAKMSQDKVEPVTETLPDVVADDLPTKPVIKPKEGTEAVEVIQIDKPTPDQTIITFTSPSIARGHGEVVWGERTEPALQIRRKESERIEQHRQSLYNWSCRDNYPLLAIKTNLLSWAGITYEGKRAAYTPNLAVEYFFTSSWSVEAGAHYAYWHYDYHRKFWGVSGYRLEPRYWFSMRNLKHIAYLGIYGRGG